MSEHAQSWWQRLAGRREPAERVSPPAASSDSTAVEPAAGTDERRVFVRFPAAGDAAVRPAGAADAVPAQIRDVSRGGISLAVDHGFTGGTLLSVELPAADDRSGGAVLAYVLRADPLPGGGWALGCAFASELSAETLTALGGKRQRPAGPDRRAWARTPTVGTARYYPLGGSELTHLADIVDVSPAGVGLAAAERVEPGAVLSVELDCPTGTPLSTLAAVIAVTPTDDGRWLLGCSFIRELEEEEVRRLRGPGG